MVALLSPEAGDLLRDCWGTEGVRSTKLFVAGVADVDSMIFLAFFGSVLAAYFVCTPASCGSIPIGAATSTFEGAIHDKTHQP